jgi:hypothetical protein
LTTWSKVVTTATLISSQIKQIRRTKDRTSKITKTNFT